MTYLIGEAGTNYCAHIRGERLEAAQRFIVAAHAAGADAVKFQVFFKDEPLFCPVDGDEKRRVRWDQCDMAESDWIALNEYAKFLGIDMILSVFQQRGVEMLKHLKPRYVKVASRAAKSFPYKELDGPFLISTGMGTTPFIGYDPPLWLQCVSRYPAPLAEAKWRYYEGLSDHSGTIWPGLDAIFRGARFLEVHFNIEGFDAGNDAPVCLTEYQLKFLCDARDAAKVMRA